MQEFGTGFQYLLLILARIMGLFYTAPVFSTQQVNTRLRMVLAFFLAIVLYPVTRNYLPLLPPTTGGFALQVFGQAMIGVCIGFMMTIIFTAFQLAGQIFSIQVGLSFSEVLDPSSQISIPVLGTLKNTVGLLLFLTVDFQVDGVYVPAYLHLIRALANSFAMVPALVPDLELFRGLMLYMDQVLGAMLITAIKIGLPIMGIIFITSVSLGLLGRAAPQMNLMNMGIQLNIIVGIIVLFVLFPVIIPIMSDTFSRTYETMGEMLQSWPSSAGSPGLAR